MAAYPPNLQCEFERKLDERKTMQLSPEEMDLFVECVAYEAIVRATVDFRKAQRRGGGITSTSPTFVEDTAC